MSVGLVEKTRMGYCSKVAERFDGVPLCARLGSGLGHFSCKIPSKMGLVKC